MDLEQECFLFNTKEKFFQYALNQKLLDLVNNISKEYERLAVLCIGTDRSTGDCYGPLVGHNLSRSTIYDFDLYGTIHEPIHAKNLEETLSLIDIEKTLIIAVDSSLGSLNHVGHICVGYGGIRAGSGVGKNFPPVGDIYVSGIVNISGFMPAAVLQSTRLSLVYTMAERTSNAIKYVLYKKCFKSKSAV